MNKILLLSAMMSMFMGSKAANMVCTMEMKAVISNSQVQLTENMMIQDGFLKDVGRFLYCMDITFDNKGCTNGATNAFSGKAYDVSKAESGKYRALTSAWYNPTPGVN